MFPIEHFWEMKREREREREREIQIESGLLRTAWDLQAGRHDLLVDWLDVGEAGASYITTTFASAGRSRIMLGSVAGASPGFK